jgi:hypothetical protein
MCLRRPLAGHPDAKAGMLAATLMNGFQEKEK